MHFRLDPDVYLLLELAVPARELLGAPRLPAGEDETDEGDEGDDDEEDEDDSNG